MTSKFRQFRVLAAIVFLFTLTTSYQGCGQGGLIDARLFPNLKSSPGNGQGYEGLENNSGNDGNLTNTPNVGGVTGTPGQYVAGACTDGTAASAIAIINNDYYLVRGNCQNLQPVYIDPALITPDPNDVNVIVFNGVRYIRQ